MNANSNTVLDVAGGSTANGAALIQQAWAGTGSQIWFVIPFGSNAIIANYASGKVMDVAGASINDGAAGNPTWSPAARRPDRGSPAADG